MAQTFTVNDSGWTLTAYCSCDECNDGEKTETANGHKLTPDDHQKLCAAPKDIAFGTVIHVTGGWTGDLVVQDRGYSVIGKRLDVYQKSHDDVKSFGVKTNCNISYEMKMAKL